MRTLILAICLVSLAACKISSELAPDRFNPAACAEGISSNACNVDWIFSFNRESYPTKMQIILNDQVVIDECEYSNQWTKTESRYTEFRLRNFSDFDCDKSFKMKIMKINNCDSKYVEFATFSEQECFAKRVHGVKEVWVERN